MEIVIRPENTASLRVVDAATGMASIRPVIMKRKMVQRMASVDEMAHRVVTSAQPTQTAAMPTGQPRPSGTGSPRPITSHTPIPTMISPATNRKAKASWAPGTARLGPMMAATMATSTAMRPSAGSDVLPSSTAPTSTTASTTPGMGANTARAPAASAATSTRIPARRPRPPEAPLGRVAEPSDIWPHGSNTPP